MKLVYTSEDRFLVINAKNKLEDAGITVALSNEFAAGGAGELSPLDAWVELQVVNDDDYDQAVELLAQTSANQADWQCKSCNEANEGTFEICWNCQAPK